MCNDLRSDLVLRFFGSGRVSWDEQRTYTKGSAPSVCLKNTETYLDFSMSLFKTGISLNSYIHCIKIIIFIIIDIIIIIVTII